MDRNFRKISLPFPSIAGSTGGEAVGSIVARPSDRFASEAEAKQYLYCNGSSFSASQYPKLYAVLGTTTLPDLRERFLEGSDSAGIYVEAGLPNITGAQSLAYGVLGNIGGYGSLYGFNDFNPYLAGRNQGTTLTPNSAIAIDASRCNSIYGRSNTVPPSAFTVRYYVRAK